MNCGCFVRARGHIFNYLLQSSSPVLQNPQYIPSHPSQSLEIVQKKEKTEKRWPIVQKKRRKGDQLYFWRKKKQKKVTNYTFCLFQAQLLLSGVRKEPVALLKTLPDQDQGAKCVPEINNNKVSWRLCKTNTKAPNVLPDQGAKSVPEINNNNEKPEGKIGWTQ